MISNGIMKKAIAVIIGLTIAFGALTLPVGNAREQFTTASAFTVEIGECNFSYELCDRTDYKSIRITGVRFSDGKVEIPSKINHEGTVYPVTDISRSFLKNNEQIRTVIFPDSITYIGEDVLAKSKVEKIYVSKNLWHLGSAFCDDCPNLTEVECKGTKMPLNEIGQGIFYNCPQLRNEKGAICLGNWLIDCNWLMELSDKFKGITELKIADLGNDGVKITGIAPSALNHSDELVTVDLEGIEYIGNGNLLDLKNLKSVKNTDSLKCVIGLTVDDVPWV